MIESQVAHLIAPYELTFKVDHLDENKLDAGSLLCESLVSAISPGTELAAYTGMAPLRPGKVYPRLVGYCNVARVINYGTDVKNIQLGDRVLTFSSHRSYFVVPEADVLAVIPETICSEHAACTYLYHLGYDAVLKSGVNYGSAVVVIGLGVLGLGAVAMAKNSGANVYAISDQSIPAEIALELGAKQTFNRKEINILEGVLGDRLADIVITTSNSWGDWLTALIVAGIHSCIAVVGFPQNKNIAF